MSDASIRRGVRDLLATESIDAIHPDQALALAALLHNRGIRPGGPTLDDADAALLEAALRAWTEVQANEPGWGMSAGQFVALARSFLGVEVARNLIIEDRRPGQHRVGLMGRMDPGDFRRLADELGFL